MNKYDKSHVKYVKFLNEDQNECYFNIETKERMTQIPNFEDLYKLIDVERAKK